MDAVFIKLLNMSITASIIALVVILLRLLLKRAPKWIMGVLWGFVAIRLVCPFSIESIFSLIPSAEPIPQNIIEQGNSAVGSGLQSFNQAASQISSGMIQSNATGSVNQSGMIVSVLSVIWLIGIAAMLIYAAISYLRIYKKVKEAVPLQGNIWVCDHIPAPFIRGIIRPRIYLPSTMNKEDAEYVLAHEKAHLKRKDFIWKPLGFLLLSVYWYNPILWVAYILLCRDIELACDEKVIREFGAETKKPYSDALINCSVPGKIISACPLAFGEVGVKERVKGVLNYKKPAFWVIIVAIVVCIAVGICLLTNPPTASTILSNDLAAFVDSQIISYNRLDKDSDNISYVDYEVLAVKKRGKEVTVYMLAMYQEFSFDGDEIINEASACTPTVITAQKTFGKKDGHYKAVEYWIPRAGSLYAEDIKDKFPVDLWYEAFDSQKYYEEMMGKCSKYMLKHYAKNGGISVGGAQIPPDIEKEPKEYSLQYSCSSEKDNATLSLEPQNKMCAFSFSLLSSFWVEGTYKEDGKFIIVTTHYDGTQQYFFKKKGDSLVFDADKSTPMPSYAYSAGAKAEVCLPDGAVFKLSDTKNEPTEKPVYFNASILKVNEGTILVKPIENSYESKSADKIYVSTDVLSGTPVPELKEGDNIRIIYNGMIAETYPAQINKVYAIYLLGYKGEVLLPTEQE